MSRKKKTAEHVNHDRWLVSYADFITLLFAFFVVLFSSSQVDKRKVGKVSVAMQEAFQQMGIFQTANSRTPMVTADPLPAENIQLIEDGKGMSGRGKMASPSKRCWAPLPLRKIWGPAKAIDQRPGAGNSSGTRWC